MAPAETGATGQVPTGELPPPMVLVGAPRPASDVRPGRVLARDESRRPFVLWVIYETDGREFVAACYVEASLLRRDIDGSWYHHVWHPLDAHAPRKARVERATVAPGLGVPAARLAPAG